MLSERWVWSGNIPASIVRVFIHVSFLLIGCQCYRPDAERMQKLTVVAGGAFIHDQHDNELHPNATKADQVKPAAASLAQQSADTTTTPKGSADTTTTPKGNADQKKPAEPTKKPEGKLRCVGAGKGWKCAADGNRQEGADVAAGGYCKIMCESKNTTAKEATMESKGVRCDGQTGRYEKEPECINKIQCDNGGGGWTCKEHKADVDKLNIGDTCTPVCAEPDFGPINAGPSKCTAKDGEGVLVPATGCKQLAKCPSKADSEGWICKDTMEGREQVVSGGTCKVNCTKSLQPLHDSVTCHDGKYEPTPPRCLTPEQKKAELEKEAAAHKAGAASLWISASSILVPVLMLMT